MRIEQIVIAWSDANAQAGCRVLGRTNDIDPADVKEIVAWGPEHGAAAAPRPSAISYDCHPLASGAFCIGRTGVFNVRTPGRQRAGDNRSCSLYTHCLVIQADDALRHAKHFPLLLRAAENAGAFRYGAEPPATMQPLMLDPTQVAAGDASFAAQTANAKRALSARSAPDKDPRPAADSINGTADSSLRQAHAPHHRSAESQREVAKSEAGNLPRHDEEPTTVDAASVNAAKPEMLQLDRAVDEAIGGGNAALGEFAALWLAAEHGLEPGSIDDSRERYLRRASSVWTDYLNDVHYSSRSLASIDVLCLLLDV
jgi:hypothetical protein